MGYDSYCYSVMGYGDFSEEKTAKMTWHILPEAGSSYFCNFSANIFFCSGALNLPENSSHFQRCHSRIKNTVSLLSIVSAWEKGSSIEKRLGNIQPYVIVSFSPSFYSLHLVLDCQKTLMYSKLHTAHFVYRKMIVFRFSHYLFSFPANIAFENTS